MYYIVDQGIIRRADSTVRHLVALTIDGEVMVLVMIRVISFTYHYELKKQQQQYLRTWLGGWAGDVYKMFAADLGSLGASKASKKQS